MIVKFIETETIHGKETHAIIEHANGSFTSMLKSNYEAMQAEQSEAVNYLTPPDTIESTQPDEADLTEGTN
jgi:hypothetical protein